jgi:hypothetical protein
VTWFPFLPFADDRTRGGDGRRSAGEMRHAGSRADFTLRRKRERFSRPSRKQ